MPNIGAFIAWGIITALFIPTGWLPNETLAKLAGPMITYLPPLLIGYTGGRLLAANAVAWWALSLPWALLSARMMFLLTIAGPLGRLPHWAKKFDSGRR